MKTYRFILAEIHPDKFYHCTKLWHFPHKIQVTKENETGVEYTLIGVFYATCIYACSALQFSLGDDLSFFYLGYIFRCLGLVNPYIKAK